MLGRQVLADAVHGMEAIFKEPPEGWSRGVLDRLFEVAAALRQAVERVGTDEEEGAFSRVRALSVDPGSIAREPAGGEPSADGAPEESDSTGDEAARAGTAAGATADGVEDRDAGEDEPHAGQGAGEVVRVPFAGLDTLLTRVGELVTLESRVERLLTAHRRELEAVGIRRALEDAAEGLSRVTEFLHETTMELRLVPIRRVFERFPSVVRDLARRGGKQIRVETEGDDVQIDKAMADAISEPLLHLVRNAVDHGFDANGRSSGTVTLSAARLGDRVRIAVEDDGRGLDRAGIVARAREMGIIGPEETIDEAEAADLIFRPGFSTREEATTVSGRGVGLDVVRRKATALRGYLAVESAASGGTRFVLDLPLTLAIVPAVLFEAAGETLAIPAADVEESLRRPRIRYAGGAEVVSHRDEVIPVARPARLFGWDTDVAGTVPADGGGDGSGTGSASGSSGAPAGDPAADRFALIVRRGTRRMALLASRLLDQRDVVVKALPSYLGAQRAVSGAAVTHEADVVLVLDVGGLLDLNLAVHRRGAT